MEHTSHIPNVKPNGIDTEGQSVVHWTGNFRGLRTWASTPNLSFPARLVIKPSSFWKHAPPSVHVPRDLVLSSVCAKLLEC